MTIAYIAIGSNKGHREKTMAQAVRRIGKISRTRVKRVSPLYETEPVGGPRQNDYLNGVIEIDTNLTPTLLLKNLLRLEKALGRKRRVKWGPRRIDLDILTFGKLRLKTSTLTIPHPYYYKRRFVLIPFCKLAPKLRHPVLKMENKTLLRQLTPLGQRVTIFALWKNKRFYRFKKRKNQKLA